MLFLSTIEPLNSDRLFKRASCSLWLANDLRISRKSLTCSTLETTQQLVDSIWRLSDWTVLTSDLLADDSSRCDLDARVKTGDAWRYTWKGGYQPWGIEQRTVPLCCSHFKGDMRRSNVQPRESRNLLSNFHFCGQPYLKGTTRGSNHWNCKWRAFSVKYATRGWFLIKWELWSFKKTGDALHVLQVISTSLLSITFEL